MDWLTDFERVWGEVRSLGDTHSVRPSRPVPSRPVPEEEDYFKPRHVMPPTRGGAANVKAARWACRCLFGVVTVETHSQRWDKIWSDRRRARRTFSESTRASSSSNCPFRIFKTLQIIENVSLSFILVHLITNQTKSNLKRHQLSLHSSRVFIQFGWIGAWMKRCQRGACIELL